MHKSEINFFKALENSKVIKKGNRGNIIGGTLLILLVCSLNIFMYAYLYYTNRTTDMKIDEHLSYMSSVDNAQNQQSYRQLKAEVDAMKAATESIKLLDTQIENLEKFNLDFYNRVMVFKPERVEISDIVFNSETLEIKCTTRDNSPPADYALALDDSGIFDGITYEGFEVQGGTGDTSLQFSIKCTIKRGDQGEN